MNQRELEDRGESSCDILKQQLAAEKATRLEAEKELAEIHVKDSVRTKEHNILVQENRAEKARADKAEAACAEMRSVIAWECKSGYCNDVQHHPVCLSQWAKAKEHALSTSCGIGWLSPEVAAKVHESLRRCVAECDYMPAHDGLAALKDGKLTGNHTLSQCPKLNFKSL